MTREKLKALLVDAGLVSDAEFSSAAAEASRRGVSIDYVLIEQNVIPEEYLGRIMAEEMGVPFARLSREKIPDHILRAIPEQVAKRNSMIAFGINERGQLKLAMHDPLDLELIRLVEKKMQMQAEPHFATHQGIEAGLEQYTKDLESVINGLLESGALPAREKGEEDSTIIRIAELIMDYAYKNNASDVHLEPQEKAVLVRYRIDGILHDVVTIPKAMLDPIVTRIKVLAKLRTDEHFAAQDGKFQEIIDGERIDVRVSVIPIVDGEKVVMRLLTEKGKKYSLTDLGLSDQDLKKVKKHLRKAFGMILATGPTGSGKTTTMYSVLKILNTRDVNIATIEDPIEYRIEGVNQIQVNVKSGLTFASGLRSIVRQDPDIIMVGEIRDEETAGIAVNSAMTGHMVLSTLHTNDAATTLPRFRDMQIEPFLIASTVNVIIAQRLIRKVCQHCIVSYDLSIEELADFVPVPMMKKYFHARKDVPWRAYKGKGCEQCGQSGYRGRIGIFEVLEMDDTIRDMVMKNVDAKQIADQAIKNGMTTIFEDGIRKVAAGVTTLEEVVRVAG